MRDRLVGLPVGPDVVTPAVMVLHLFAEHHPCAISCLATMKRKLNPHFWCPFSLSSAVGSNRLIAFLMPKHPFRCHSKPYVEDRISSPQSYLSNPISFVSRTRFGRFQVLGRSAFQDSHQPETLLLGHGVGKCQPVVHGHQKVTLDRSKQIYTLIQAVLNAFPSYNATR
jgi:hypothetical protein